jgi:hypothetical protein
MKRTDMRANPLSSMFELIRNALSLCLSGKAFRDYRYLSRRLIIGAGFTALVMAVLSLLMDSPIAVAAIAGFAGGALQPFLFQDVRYQ